MKKQQAFTRRDYKNDVDYNALNANYRTRAVTNASLPMRSQLRRNAMA